MSDFFGDGKLTGDMFCFYISGKQLACELSCEFSFSNDLRAISPYQAAGFRQIIPGIKSWQMSVSANFISYFTGADFKTILTAFISGSPMQVAMRTKIGYSPSFLIGGTVYPASGSLASSGSDIVGYSSVFTGSGPLTYESEANTDNFWRIINANPAQSDKPILIQTTL